MAYVKIRPRRDTISAWEYNNPILSEGEEGYEFPDTGVGTGAANLKIGDGVTAWNSLPYAIHTTEILELLSKHSTTLTTLTSSFNDLVLRVTQAEADIKALQSGIKPDHPDQPDKPDTPVIDDANEAYVGAMYLGAPDTSWIMNN